jgi:hypothetical protein
MRDPARLGHSDLQHRARQGGGIPPIHLAGRIAIRRIVGRLQQRDGGDNLRLLGNDKIPVLDVFHRDGLAERARLVAVDGLPGVFIRQVRGFSEQLQGKGAGRIEPLLVRVDDAQLQGYGVLCDAQHFDTE